MHLLTSLALASSALLTSAAPAQGQNTRRQDADAYAGYLFTYFTGNTLEGENIYLAASNGNNALDWRNLNSNQPILTSSYGERGLRHPFIIRSHDGAKFWILATDLSIGGGTSWDASQRNGSRYIEIWESSDLVNWSEQRHTLVSPPTAGMTWAPEAHWDDSIGAYVVYWASKIYAESDPEHSADTYPRMMYATTTDFVTFSEAKVWTDFNRIDSTVLQSEGVYYRFSKDYGVETGTGCEDIVQESSDDLLALQPPADTWPVVDGCIGADSGLGAVEGPTAFKANAGDERGEKFYLFVDQYTGSGYTALETEDIANPDWTVSSDQNLPASPRHGTVLPVTQAELDRVNEAYGASAKRSVLPSSIKARQEEEEAGNGSPVLPGYYADPNIFVSDCTYYIYATTDGYPGWGGKDFYVWSSPDLVSWTRSEAPILTLNGMSGNVPWATGNAWAPTIIEKKGKFYFYFSGANPDYDDAKTIGVAVAESPEGPFTAEAEPFITNTEAITTGQAIDADAFHDPKSGNFYLYWGNGTPLMAELSEDMLSLAPDTTTEIEGLADFREAAFVVYRDPYYHMTYSIDDTRSEDYRVGYATATTPRGPFTYRGVVLQKDVEKGILGTGHDSVINVPGTDEWVMAYHRFAIPGGNGTEREVTLDWVRFGEDGLMEAVVPTLEGVGKRVIGGCGGGYE